MKHSFRVMYIPHQERLRREWLRDPHTIGQTPITQGLSGVTSVRMQGQYAKSPLAGGCAILTPSGSPRGVDSGHEEFLCKLCYK